MRIKHIDEENGKLAKEKLQSWQAELTLVTDENLLQTGKQTERVETS